MKKFSSRFRRLSGLILFIPLFVVNCLESNKSSMMFQIEEFYSASQSEGNRIIKPPAKQGLDSSIFEYYLVDGFSESSGAILKIDSFVCSRMDTAVQNFQTYALVFYRKSDITNNKHIADSPRDLVRYSLDNDLIARYKWTNNKKFGYRYYYGMTKNILQNDKFNCSKY